MRGGHSTKVINSSKHLEYHHNKIYILVTFANLIKKSTKFPRWDISTTLSYMSKAPVAFQYNIHGGVLLNKM